MSLRDLQHFEEARSVLCKTMPIARRVFGDNYIVNFRMKKIYAEVLYRDPAATLDDLREAVMMLEELDRTTRRVLGGAHPLTEGIVASMQAARAALGARETPSSGSA